MEQKLLKTAGQTKYPLEALIFVHHALDYTVRRIHGEPDTDQPDKSRHISGRQFCYGLRDYAIEQYGLLARTVLQHWNIHSCADFGHIVFALIDGGVMARTDEDHLDDFIDVYNFAEAFRPTLSIK